MEFYNVHYLSVNLSSIQVFKPIVFETGSISFIRLKKNSANRPLCRKSFLNVTCLENGDDEQIQRDESYTMLYHRQNPLDARDFFLMQCPYF
jgi:hypothetical protein